MDNADPRAKLEPFQALIGDLSACWTGTGFARYYHHHHHPDDGGMWIWASENTPSAHSGE